MCIRGQTLPDWELIIVDDCSTDDTLSVAEALSARDRRIRVIGLPENGGVSAARNRGMDIASGEYILFLDPDDTYEPTLLATIRQTIDKAILTRKKKPEMIVYSLSEDYHEGAALKYRKIHTRPDGIYTDPSSLHKEILELEKETMLGYPWNKAYRLSYLREHKLRFPKITHIEDILFNIEAARHLETLAVVSIPLYHYRNDGQARLTGKDIPDYFELQKQRITAFIELQEKWQAEDKSAIMDEVCTYASGMYFRSFVSELERRIARGEGEGAVLSAAAAEEESALFGRLKPYLPESKTAKLLYEPLAKGELRKAYDNARLIHSVKTHLPYLYARLKQHR